MKRVIAAVALAGLAMAPAARASTHEGQEKFTAFAVDLGRSRGPATSVVQVTVDRWSTPEERSNLESILQESGSDALLAAMRKAKPVGHINTTGSLGYDLRFAYQIPLPTGGRRIIVGTDRPLSFYEASTRPRSVDYPFTILEMHVDENGRGQGKLIVAGKVTAMGDNIELENYTTTPVQLTQVQLDK